jgi:hypothetical protein
MAINIPIITDFDSRGIKKAEKAFGEIEKAGAKVGTSLKNALLPVGLALGGLAVAGAKFAMAAAEDQKSAALLARQLKVTTRATDAQVKATEDFILQMSLANGVADDELRPSLSKLVRGTKNVSKAQKLLALSLDIAKGSGKSLSQVTDSISKALGGNMGALARLSPEVKQMVKDHKSLDQILQALGKTYAGSATTAANTFQGRMDRLKVAINETKESIGYALLPIFEKMVTFIQTRILPVIQKFVDKVGRQGLSKTLKETSGEIFNWYREADGATGATLDFAAAIVTLGVAFKGLAFISGIASTLSAISTAVGGLGTISAGVGAAGLGTLAAVVGLVVLNLTALFGLLRDKNDFAYIKAAVLDFASAIANAFILMGNAIIDAGNLLIKLGNLAVPGNPFAEMANLDYFSMSRSTQVGNYGRAPTVANPSNYKDVGVPSITVNTGIGDPVAIGKQVADVLSAYQRRTGNTLAMP